MTKNNINQEQKEFIERKRAEILIELREYLADVGHVMAVDEVIAEVYNDDNNEEFEDFVLLLAGDNPDTEVAQEIAMELFNYFPRKTLDGQSFAEKISFEELQKMEKAFQDFKDGL